MEYARILVHKLHLNQMNMLCYVIYHRSATANDEIIHLNNYIRSYVRHTQNHRKHCHAFQNLPKCLKLFIQSTLNLLII